MYFPGNRRRVAQLRLQEIHWGVRGDWKKGPVRNCLNHWSKSSCLQRQQGWCNRCLKRTVFSLVWCQEGGNKERVISSSRLQTGHSSSLLGERTNTVNAPHQRLSGGSDTTSTQAQVQSLLNWEEGCLKTQRSEEVGLVSQRRCGEFSSEPNPHSALMPSNIRQKPVHHRQKSSKF